MGRETNEFMQDERRRKEAARIAEDLFHNEKVKFCVFYRLKEGTLKGNLRFWTVFSCSIVSLNSATWLDVWH